MANKSTIKNWFTTGSKPTQEQFWQWLDSYRHNDDSITMTSIDGLGDALSAKVDVSQLTSKANTSADNIDRSAWRSKLGVGDLPTDLVYSKDLEQERVDRYNADGKLQTDLSVEIQNRRGADAALQNNINTKLDSPTSNNTSDYVLMGDGSTKPAGDLGKNIGNTDLTTSSNRTLTQGYSYVHATAGKPYYITGLQDKSADISFNRIKVQDSNGQEAFTTGVKQLSSNMKNATDLDKLDFRKNMLTTSESYSVGQPRIDNVVPPILDKTLNHIQYVTIVGLNLYVDNITPSAMLEMKHVDTGTIYNITNFAVLQSNPNSLSFGLNWTNYPSGDYEFKVLHNSIWSQVNSQAVLRVRDELSEMPTFLNWNKIDSSGVNTNISGNNIFAETINNTKTSFLSSSVVTNSELTQGVCLVIALSSLNLYGQSNSYPEVVLGLTSEQNNNLGSYVNFGIIVNPSPPAIMYSPSRTTSGLFNDQLYILIKGGIATMFWLINGRISTESISISSDLSFKIYTYKGNGNCSFNFSFLKKYKLS